MCDVNGQFKLCTCSEKINKKKPYWVLKTNRQEGEEINVLGMFSKPNILFTPIVKKNIIKRLNSEELVFDFEYRPQQSDLLKLCGEFDEYYCEFDNGKWVWLENFHYIGKDESKFNKKLKGFIDGSKSKLMVLLDEYNKITKTQLYRNDNFNGFLDTQNSFEDYLFGSKQWSEKEMIELIEGEIKRLKTDN